MPSAFFRSFLLALCCAVCMSAAAQSIVVEEKELAVSTEIRVKSHAGVSLKISNPVWWQPIRTIVADGSVVKKGDVVATIEEKQLLYELQMNILQKQLTQIYLEKRVTDINNQNLDLKEQWDLLEDKLASLESRLNRQKSEPTEDDIRIRRGRLRIAEMNREAAEKDLEKAKERFARRLISRAELDSYEKTYKESVVKETYAKAEVQYVEQPIDRECRIQITEYEIATTKLEMDKFRQEIADQEALSEIQKKSTETKAALRERQIREKQEELRQITVRAPADGIVSINRFNGNEITQGTRMWLNYVFMEIPDLKSVCFRGVLPESRRQLHQVGDVVTVRINGWRDEPIAGRLKSISTLSHDLSEKEDAGWDRDKSFGTKVFDVEIEMLAPVSWLRPGMFGIAEIQAASSYRGPAVPLRYVKKRGARHYLSVDGVYQEVSGMAIGAVFFLKDPAWLGRPVEATGHFPEELQETSRDERDNRLSATGELAPVHSQDILVGDIGWWPWPKVTWLQEEETQVKAGDVVARLDPKEREKQLQNHEASTEEHRVAYKEALNQQELTRRQGIFRLKKAEYDLKKAQLEAHIALDMVDPLALAAARKNYDLAVIAEEAQAAKVKREEERARPTVSPVELARMKRALLRCRLKTEDAKIQLDIAMEGATKLEKSDARLQLLIAENNLIDTKNQVEYDNLSRQRTVLSRQRWLRRSEKGLEYLRGQVANHEIKAPADGLLCYNKVFFNGAIAKVAVGNTVGRRFNILSIPDLSAMEIKVELNEKYFSQIHDGMQVEVKLPSLGGQHVPGRVCGVDLLFSNRRKKDKQIGIYSSHEPLGEVVFCVRIRLDSTPLLLKPGLLGEVIFPIVR